MSDSKYGRIAGKSSLHAEEKPELCPDGHHETWRVVLCDYKNDTDVIECSRCGQQKEATCNFDDEYD